MDNVRWSNPYNEKQGQWLKGNLHTHTHPNSGCAVIPVSESIELYKQNGYDFISLSDHMTLTEVPEPPLTLIPGIEWNSLTGEHAGIYTDDEEILNSCARISNQKILFKTLTDSDALIVLNHPDWQVEPHYSREDLLGKGPYHGIEIFNNVIERLQGDALSTTKWDWLLSSGKRVLGFVSEDSHSKQDIGHAWISVRAENTATSILQALKSGNFYGSTGVIINEINRIGDNIEIDSPNTQEIKIIGNHGQVIQRFREQKLVFNVSSLDFSYVRFDLFGIGAARAWTQPFFIKD